MIEHLSSLILKIWYSDISMSISVTLLTILSGVCLLLWGLRTIKRAVLRGYGAQVQAGIAKGTKNRCLAFICGAFVTLFLQSSTATALLASSFVGRGLMTVTAGLAIMIGADVATSLLAQILSFDMSWLAPLLLSSGIILHLIYDDGNHKRFLARIIMGLGFILTSLAIIRTAAAPLSESEILPLILAPLQAEPLLAILISAILTYLMHSGLSAVLLFATFAASGVLSLELAILFVVGANVGVGLIPMVAVMRDIPQAVQIPLGNIIMRMAVGVITLFCLPFIKDYINTLNWDIGQRILSVHIAYNCFLAIVFLPFVGTLSKICQRLSPSLETEEDAEKRPRYLDEKALGTPPMALSCATRETLHMAEILEDIVGKSLDAVTKHDQTIIDDIKEKDETLDKIFRATKDYLIRLSREELSDKEANQLMTIMNFTTNIENAGDVIGKSLMATAKKTLQTQDKFSDEGLAELKSMHKKVLKNIGLAQTIFLSSDPALAKTLLNYKKGLKVAEIESAENHMERLKKGLSQSMATSGMHMDIIRDLRRVNTYIASIAYSVLDNKK